MSNLPPFQQGGLDSLCGLYSIVNAYRIMNHASDDDAQDLFNDIIRYLSRKRLLSKYLIGGIKSLGIGMILQDVVGGCIPVVSVPWRGVPNPDLDTFWRSMQSFIHETQGGVIILSVGGYHDHWTVIESISDTVIDLYDSARIGHLSRASCTTSTPGNRRKHWLQPAQTYFLSKEANG